MDNSNHENPPFPPFQRGKVPLGKRGIEGDFKSIFEPNSYALEGRHEKRKLEDPNYELITPNFIFLLNP
jgi:hypothetical protein